MAILPQEKVGIWIGKNMICAALEWATSGGQKREAVLLMNDQCHEKKFAAFEMASHEWLLWLSEVFELISLTFNTKYLLRYFLFCYVKKANATYLSMLCKQRDHGALPPSSKIMP